MFAMFLYDDDIPEAIEINEQNWNDGNAGLYRFWCNRNLFPLGQMVLRSGNGVEAYCSSLIINLDISKPLTASWNSVTAYGTLMTHKEDGNWLYVAEMDFKEGVDRKRYADLFYFRLRLLAKTYDLDGIITYVAVGEEKNEKFLESVEEVYRNGFQAYAIVNNFRVRHGEMVDGVHFAWSFPDESSVGGVGS